MIVVPQISVVLHCHNCFPISDSSSTAFVLVFLSLPPLAPSCRQPDGMPVNQHTVSPLLLSPCSSPKCGWCYGAVRDPMTARRWSFILDLSQPWAPANGDRHDYTTEVCIPTLPWARPGKTPLGPCRCCIWPVLLAARPCKQPLRHADANSLPSFLGLHM